MSKEIIVPIQEKYALTIAEASEYFNIGENKIRNLINYNKTELFFIQNGSRFLIKRKMFSEFLDSMQSI